MTENFNKNFKVENMRKKLESSSHLSTGAESRQWQAVSSMNNHQPTATPDFEKNTEPKQNKIILDIPVPNGEDYSMQDLCDHDFSVKSLEGANFAGAKLRGANFAGSNLSKASFAGADLSHATFSGSILKEANFTGAILNGVKLTEADIQDAILLNIEIDDVGIEELQALIEFLAKYYPHKLNLRFINLTLLNLAQIDLTQLNLKGVDFTGCDMTGVNVLELDLSECIISPAQIAQALGRVPDADELRRILAPKTKIKQYNGKIADGIMEWFLGNGKEFGVFDVTREGVKIEDLMKLGKKVFKSIAGKPEPTLEEIKEHVVGKVEEKNKTHNEEMKKIIEERKKQALEAIHDKSAENEVKEKPVDKKIDQDLIADKIRSMKSMSRE